jgi:hypothetical protein
MFKLVRLACVILLVTVTLFCILGFLSAPALGTDAVWVILNSVIGVVSAGGAVWLAKAGRVRSRAFGESRSITMNHPRAISSPLSSILRQIGLTALFACGTLLVFSLTVFLPPWAKVKCERTEPGILRPSHVRMVYERTFVGYDFLLLKAKQETLERSTQPRWDGYSDVTEYQVFKPLLIAEWVIILLTAGCVYVVLTRRLHFGPEPLNGNANATRPTDGPRE